MSTTSKVLKNLYTALGEKSEGKNVFILNSNHFNYLAGISNK